MQAPTVRKLRGPGFESDGIADQGSEVLVVEPTDGFFGGLEADGDAVVAGAGFADLGVGGAGLIVSLLCVCMWVDGGGECVRGGITYLCHLTYPLRIIMISPWRTVVPCHFNVSSISSMGISCLETGLGACPFFCSYHASQSQSTPRPTIPPLSHQLCVPFVSVWPACSCVRPL
jgi:hypothetical protein